MKFRMLPFAVVVLTAAFISCSDDNEVKRKGDPDITHQGEKWVIASLEYELIDQSYSGGMSQTFKTGTKENAGAFYFIEGETTGSFEFNVEGYNKEDVFSYSIDTDNETMSIFAIQQSAGLTTNQNVLTLSGSSTATAMTLEGQLIKQSTTGQFLLSISHLSLVKE